MNYYVWHEEKWRRCKTAREGARGQLKFQLEDGISGTAKPANWQKLTGELEKKEKRPIGRPRSGKTKVIFSIDPETDKLIDAGAQKRHVTRSVYIETLIREDALEWELNPRKIN